MLCNYGCGQKAKFHLKNGKWCCSKSQNSCLEVRKKMSISHKGQIGPNKGKKWEEEVKRRMGIPKKGKPTWNKGKRRCQKAWNKGKSGWMSIDILNEKSRKMKNRWKDLNSIFNSKEYRNVLSNIMKTGGAVHANSFIKDDSKPEKELFVLACKLLPRPVHKYPIYRVGKGKKSYNVDIADSSLGIILEYDGWYHFDTEEHKGYHKKRQKEIEEDGWKFLRYNIFQPFPTLEQVKEDIQKLVI